MSAGMALTSTVAGSPCRWLVREYPRGTPSDPAIGHAEGTLSPPEPSPSSWATALLLGLMSSLKKEIPRSHQFSVLAFSYFFVLSVKRLMSSERTQRDIECLD